MFEIIFNTLICVFINIMALIMILNIIELLEQLKGFLNNKRIKNKIQKENKELDNYINSFSN